MQNQEPIQLENDSSQPIIIPGQDPSQNSPSFVPESYRTAQSLRQSPNDPFSSSVNSTHSQILNNSYSHQFVNNFNNLRNAFSTVSPTSNFSPKADPPQLLQRQSVTDIHNSNSFQNPLAITPNISVSQPRPSLLTSKLASSNSNSNSTFQSAEEHPGVQHLSSQDVSQQQGGYQQSPGYSSSFTTNDYNLPLRSSNITIQQPTTSAHFKTSGVVNSFTPHHNTPSVISSSYSSAPNSVPNNYNPSSSFQFTRSQPTTITTSETAKPVEFIGSTESISSTSHDQIQIEPDTQQQFQEQQQQQNDVVPQDSDHLISSTVLDSSTNEYHLDIVNHPVDDLLLMLSALLQKIIEANDNLHPHHYHHASQLHETQKFTANVLAFHGRNVPAISIHAYLSRILKYCPVTNEVFLTLLVYFDRIAKRANAGDSTDATTGEDQQLFVMDSYNIHRLIIAGITVASKFFSDIFYKNSRYAKVGGLPLEELNHLELQFLLLVDFRLLIQIEELQRYADLLLKFWRREQSKKTGSKE